MNKFLLLALLLVGLVCVSAHAGHDHSHGDDHDHDDDVLVLTAANFDETVAAHEVLLIEFYAPWCGHCKKLAPEYSKAAHELHGKASIAKMDCTDGDNNDVCSQYGVKGFPTLKLFRNEDAANPTDYAGARTSAGIVAFMKKQTQPAYYVVASEEELKAKTGDEDIVIVAYVADAEENPSFLKFANALREQYTFAVATYGNAGDIVMTRSFDEPTTFKGEGIKELKEWATKESFPPLGLIGPDTFQKYLDRGLPLTWCFLDFGDDKVAEYEATFTAVAKKFKGVTSMVKLDGVQFKQHAEHFGLTGANPGIVIEDKENGNKKYIYDQTNDHTDEASLTAFLQGFVDGTLTAFTKSEEIPETQEGNVVTVVGKSFDDEVLNSEANVLVEFYAPWCGHCKKLTPVWEELADTFADHSGVKVVKVDATANDVPYDIKGFPTLVYYPAGDKTNPVPYKGGRDIEALTEFLNEKAGPAPAAAPAATGHDEL